MEELLNCEVEALNVELVNKVKKELLTDEKIFDSIPVKKEVKAIVSGMYIVSVKTAHGKTDPVPQKKKSAFKKMVEKLQDKTGANPIKK